MEKEPSDVCTLKGAVSKKIQMKKRGLSTIIATVLIIMLTLATFVIIAGVIVPMIKKALEKGKTCFEARDQISIGDFTCTNSTHTRVMITRGNKDVEINGLIISLISGGNSERYEINNGVSISGVKMYNGTTTLAIPESSGSGKTYLFDVANVNSVSVIPAFNGGESCDTITSEEVSQC